MVYLRFSQALGSGRAKMESHFTCEPHFEQTQLGFQGVFHTAFACQTLFMQAKNNPEMNKLTLTR